MCDRTAEFRQAVAGLSQASKEPFSSNRKKKPEEPSSKSAFHNTTAEIANGIHRTTTTLGELTKLIRRQGLFDDPSDKINELIVRIKEDISDLNSQCDVAQEYVESTKRASKGQASSYNSNVVTSLKSDLMKATKTFKNALEMRSHKMKSQQEKKIQMAGNSVLSPMRQFKANQQNHGGDSSDDRKNGSVKTNRYHSLPNPYDSSSGNTPSNVYGASPSQQQQMLLAPPAEVQYYEQRQEAVSEVEKTIGELGTLFKRLSTMINEQTELVERIDDDIENAIEQSDKAHGALMKTYEQVSSNRGMYTKLSAIAVVSGLFFVLFLM